ncbi:MAG TPA: ThiF family adenylyltransferase [Halanaerobiales bacterium]|nr:ThiF family adenylyltransferase [Halanaerobiales bacterium]
MNFWQRQQLMFSGDEGTKLYEMVALIAGVGGLGTHIALELQRVGVKKLYLVDYDRITEGNLNRQVLYGVDDIGASKVQRARKMLEGFSLGTEIVAVDQVLTINTELPDDIDIIFDGLDNIQARFILEELACQKGYPLIHGAINSWYGQITTILPGNSLGFKAIYGKYQNEEKYREEIPAFSPVVSLVSSIEVIEEVKVFLDRGGLLVNRLLLVDADDYSLNILKLD